MKALHRATLYGAALAFALCAGGCASQSATDVAPLAEGWQYRWGDAPAWAGEPWESTGWKPLALPAAAPDRDGATHLWMRVRLPPGRDPSSRLFLRYVDQNLEAFVDGRPVYRFGDAGTGRLRLGRPFHLIPVSGGEILALRIRSEHATIGVFGVPRLGAEGALQGWILRDGFVWFVVGMALLMSGAIALAVALLFLRKDPRLFALGLLSIASGVYSFVSVYSPAKQLLFDAPELLWYLELAAVYLVPATYFAFYAAISHGLQRWVARAMWIFFAAFTAFAVAGSLLGLFPITATLRTFHNLLTVAVLVGLGMAGRSALRGSAEARVFVAGLAAVALAGLHDVLVDERLLARESALIIWGFVAFVASLSLFVLRSYLRQVFERDSLNARIAAQHDELSRARERITETARAVRDEARAIAEAAARQAATASEQATANHETTTTVAEIAQISKQATEGAQSVAGKAEQSVELSRQGERSVIEAVAGVEDLSRTLATLAHNVGALTDRTQQIGGIIETVEELAERSNLLALNASIEAARAGEQGKGFAVVAREMVALAEQSKASGVKVRTLLAEVASGTEAAAQGSSDGTRSAERVVGLARDAGATISSLASALHDSADVARQIARASQEQTRGVEQIVHAMTESSTALDEALEGTRRIEEIARRLTRLAEGLADLSQTSRVTPPPAAAA